MIVDGLPIPSLLQQMIDTGRWPANHEAVNAQNMDCLAPPERIAKLAPEEQWLVLLSPPFATVEQLINGGESWFWMEWAPPVTNPKRALVIGDFGLGSDAPILLDYSGANSTPRVLRLRYDEKNQRQWVLMAVDFETFVAELGL